ncbi:hypothetical protein BJ165DRAFT_3891 [Panaeolus papilionaceus]|nr:hypothetical protein BJ165DRAFT_3891 [Panaeolus papilionaceus]
MHVKNLSFHVEHVEIVDIPDISKALGVKPARVEPVFYTLPAMYDPRTKTALPDSLAILQYLDEQYPDAPILVPKGTEGLIAAFKAAFAPIDKKIFKFLIPKMVGLVAGTKSEGHFIETRTKSLGNLDELAPRGADADQAWAELKAMYDDVNSWYGTRQFIMGGEYPTYADLLVAGQLWWYRSTLGSESEEWKRILSWNDGRWGQIIAHFDNLKLAK